jgi:hypothetical protein
LNIPKQKPEVGPTAAWLRNDHAMIVQLAAAVASGRIESHADPSPKEIVNLAIGIAWEIHRREQGIP